MSDDYQGKQIKIDWPAFQEAIADYLESQPKATALLGPTRSVTMVLEPVENQRITIDTAAIIQMMGELNERTKALLATYSAVDDSLLSRRHINTREHSKRRITRETLLYDLDLYLEVIKGILDNPQIVITVKDDKE